ncbi:MAG: hypothetical protein E6J90_08380 [Deltaproteobacteria bacterium]|nr:MAG: hypothetical protein E6J90_08380 [Deltaproteobacteria bacterium]
MWFVYLAAGVIVLSIAGVVVPRRGARALSHVGEPSIRPGSCAIAVALGRNAQNSIDTRPDPRHTVAGSVSRPLWSRGRANESLRECYECLKVRSSV